MLQTCCRANTVEPPLSSHRCRATAVEPPLSRSGSATPRDSSVRSGSTRTAARGLATGSVSSGSTHTVARAVVEWRRAPFAVEPPAVGATARSERASADWWRRARITPESAQSGRYKSSARGEVVLPHAPVATPTVLTASRRNTATATCPRRRRSRWHRRSRQGGGVSTRASFMPSTEQLSRRLQPAADLLSSHRCRATAVEPPLSRSGSATPRDSSVRSGSTRTAARGLATGSVSSGSTHTVARAVVEWRRAPFAVEPPAVGATARSERASADWWRRARITPESAQSGRYKSSARGEVVLPHAPVATPTVLTASRRNTATATCPRRRRSRWHRRPRQGGGVSTREARLYYRYTNASRAPDLHKVLAFVVDHRGVMAPRALPLYARRSVCCTRRLMAR